MRSLPKRLVSFAALCGFADAALLICLACNSSVLYAEDRKQPLHDWPEAAPAAVAHRLPEVRDRNILR